MFEVLLTTPLDSVVFEHIKTKLKISSVLNTFFSKNWKVNVSKMSFSTRSSCSISNRIEKIVRPKNPITITGNDLQLFFVGHNIFPKD